ncbi:MAG: glycosyltransferase family 4 protein [Candidatus Marinimicrobia bacterium]|nr:glycosyltransferase family 4 protein [Candidatus Neomarinimicrobiota bacterium]
MKIIQVCPRYYPDIGGVETHVKEISERLAKRGFEVEVVCTDPARKHPKEDVINGVRVRRFRSIAPNDAYFLAPQIYFYLKKAKCDVIHAHNYHALPAFFAGLAKNGRRFIFTPHTFGFPTTFPRNIFHKVYKVFGRFMFNAADKIVSVSKIEEEWLKNIFKVPENKLCYIPLPIDIGDKRKEWKGGGKGDIKIAFIGRLSEEKNVKVLISAFKLVKEDHPECELYIVGDGPLRAHLESLSKHISDIHFLGSLVHEETLRFLDKIDIFVLPSQFEVSPVSVLEAMSKQIPVIVTPVGELPYTLKHGENCLFAKISDADDLSMKILTLIEDKSQAKRIAENGRSFVEEKHDISKIIETYVKLYTT